jgi:hypothetical protein
LRGAKLLACAAFSRIRWRFARVPACAKSAVYLPHAPFAAHVGDALITFHASSSSSKTSLEEQWQLGSSLEKNKKDKVKKKTLFYLTGRAY